jgi:phosphoglycerate dehydrogenase-like enzyme
MAFRAGITADFHRDLGPSFAALLSEHFGGSAIEVATLEDGAAIDSCDAILALGWRVTAATVQDVKRLTLIARWGVGYDLIDTAALTQHDVALAITPNAVRRPVADSILALIFALTTNLVEQDRVVRQGGWRPALSRRGWSVKGRTLGSLGCGNIGGEMFRLAASLGFGRFIAHDPYLTNAAAARLEVELVDLDTLFRESDYLAINSPLNAATRGLVNERLLRLMRPTAYLINTARGPIVDEPALQRALAEKWIAGAGLDVFAVEPLAAGSRWRELPNVILAPHALAWTEEIVRDNTAEACGHILTVARGEVPPAIVNRDVLTRPGFQAKLERYRK